jgi:Laminin G domain
MRTTSTFARGHSVGFADLLRSCPAAVVGVLRRHRFLVGRCVVTAAVVACALTSAGRAVAATIIADWEMNEAAGATRMHDSGPHHLSGTIGSAVETGVSAGGARGYRWRSRNMAGKHPERLVKVTSSLLNPGKAAFVVKIRLRTGAGNQNIVQKGQARTSGGMWKIDMVKGHVKCTFKGSRGRVGVGSRKTIWDSVWHTVRCVRRSTGVSIRVDGGRPRRTAGATGKIANSSKLSIGGKASCDPPRVECDYYIGLLDRVVVRRP